MLQTKILSLRLVFFMRDLVYPDLLHSILRLILNIFVSLLLLDIRIVLILSLHLVSTLYPGESQYLMFVAFQFLLHENTMVLVCFIVGVDFFVPLPYPLGFFWRIFFFFNHTKLILFGL